MDNRVIEWFKSSKIWGRLGYDPTARVANYNTVTIQNKNGHDFAVFVPSIYNLAKTMTKGMAFESDGPEKKLVGYGNMARQIKKRDALAQEIVSLKAKDSVTTGKIASLEAQLKAFDAQIEYLQTLALDYFEFRLWADTQASARLRDDRAKLTTNMRAADKLDNRIRALDAAIETDKQRYIDYCDAFSIAEDLRILKGNDRALDDAKLAQVQRPGVYTSQDAAQVAVEKMTRQLRGKNLPYRALVPTPENPNRLKTRDYVANYTTLQKKRKNGDSDYFTVSGDIGGCAVALDKGDYQFSTFERVFPPLAKTLGVLFVAAVTATLTGALLFSLLTPVGAPLWAVILCAAAMFAVDVLVANDDWGPRAERVMMPWMRLFSGTAFNRDGISYSNAERPSTLRAIMTAGVLLFVGFDIAILGAGTALGFKEFFKEQGLLAKIHPVGLIVTLVVLSLFFVNGLLSPYFGEYLTRVGLNVNTPDEKHQFDPAVECAHLLEDDAYVQSSEAADRTASEEAQRKMDDKAVQEQRFSERPAMQFGGTTAANDPALKKAPGPVSRHRAALTT